MGGLSAIVVGSSFGGRIQVPALRAAGFEIAALVGRDPVRTKARAAELGVPLASVDLAEALAVPGVSVVAVSTPPDSHIGPVLASLAAGKHVLCEKPFATNASDARRMLHAAERAGVVHMLGTEFRWAPDEAMVRRVIRSGILGELALASFVQHSALVASGLPKAFNDEWWFDSTRGGGILNAAGVHVIDRFRTWMGEITAVSAHLQVIGDHPTGSAEDSYTLTMRFASGAVGTAQHCSSAFGTPSRITRVFGRLGSVWSDGTDAWLGYRDGSHRLDVPPDLQVPPAPAPSADPREAFTHLELGPYIRLAERFRHRIEGSEPSPDSPPTPTFHDGLAAQLVIDAARRSNAGNGTWVDVAAA